MNKWAVWYADGTAYTGKTREEWQALPDEGIILIYQVQGWEKPTKFQMNKNFSLILQWPLGTTCKGGDWYWINGDSTFGKQKSISYDVDYWPELDMPYGASFPKKGKWTTDKRMEQIYQNCTDFRRWLAEHGRSKPWQEFIR